MECPECGFVQYANPKPTASALVVDDEARVMFARRAHEPSAGKLDLPGGFVEEGEDPLDALHRELREEAGIGLRDTEFVGVFMDWYRVESREVNATANARCAASSTASFSLTPASYRTRYVRSYRAA